jgi:polyphosphate kinase
VSIVGRFLEHARLYYFRNGGTEVYYLSSADSMKRNLETRVEILYPIEEPDLMRELRTILDTQLYDRCAAWDMKSDGRYSQRSCSNDETPCGTHQLMIEHAEKRQKAAEKGKYSERYKE